MHAILHRAYHALPDFSSSKGEPTGALYGLSTMVMSIITDLKPDYICACFDLPQPTYRHIAYDAYKAGRKKTDSALIEQIIRSKDVVTAMNIPMYELVGFEADDMLGTIVEKLAHDKKAEVIIASGDMDTMQLIEGKKVRVFTLKKGIKDTILYDEDAVKERFGFEPKLLTDYKGLRGDPSDNIIGIAGIGEKTATDLITNFGTIEDIYKVLESKDGAEKMKKAGIKDRIVELLKNGKDDAAFSKMLATIRRDAPIEFSLPEKSWRESVDIEKVSELFKTLEFRSLIVRVKEVFSNTQNETQTEEKTDAKQSTEAGAEKTSKDSTKTKEASAKKEKKSDSQIMANVLPMGISQQEIDKVALGVWVLDSNVTNPTLEDIYRFAGETDFEKASKKVFEALDAQGLRTVYDNIELPLMPVINQMHEDGILIDADELSRLSKEYHAQVKQLEKKIFNEAEMEFNIASPKQLREVLFDKMGLAVKNHKKTSTGVKSTKESELEKLVDAHAIVPLILQHRELSKLLSTYIDAIPTLIQSDSRLHAYFSQTGAATGRMSSSEPNLQNIPIKTELGRNIRKAFIAPQGKMLLAIDYSQVELRIAAMLSGDEKLIEIFKTGEDVHTSVAAFVFNVSLAEVTKDMRRKAKVINFGILYGMGVNALKTNLGGTRDEAQLFYNDYFKTFSRLAEYLTEVKAFALKHGYTETMFGRRRFFEGIKSRLPFIRAAAERMAINAPIQGTQADIIKIAMRRIYDYVNKKVADGELKKGDIKLMLQIHDELVFEIPEKDAEQTAEIFKKIMESVATDMKNTRGVPIQANSSLGTNWGAMK